MQTAEPIRPITALRRGIVGVWPGFWQSVATWLVACMMSAAALLVCCLLTERDGRLAALAGLSSALLAVTLSLGLVRLSLRLHDGLDAGLAVLFACAGEAPGALAAGAIALAALALVALPGVSLTMTFSLLAAVLPVWTPLAVAGGVVSLLLAAWAGSRYLFLAHVIADRGLGPVAALRAAAALTRGRRDGAAALTVLLALLNALGACAAGVGLLLTLPISMAALAHAYRAVAPDAAAGTAVAATSEAGACVWPARVD